MRCLSWGYNEDVTGRLKKKKKAAKIWDRLRYYENLWESMRYSVSGLWAFDFEFRTPQKTRYEAPGVQNRDATFAVLPVSRPGQVCQTCVICQDFPAWTYWYGSVHPGFASCSHQNNLSSWMFRKERERERLRNWAWGVVPIGIGYIPMGYITTYGGYYHAYNNNP